MRENKLNINYRSSDTKIYIAGDIHGDFRGMLSLIKNFDLSNCCIICVGDLGVGFCSFDDQISILNTLNRCLLVSGITLISVAGNHDDPKYFDGSINLTNLKLIPDYTVFTIRNKRVLFIGGAISIDRKIRTKGVDYFPEEEIRPPTREELHYIKAAPIDIIVSHDAPLCAGKNPSTLWDDPDNPVKTDAIRGRKILSEIQEIVRPKHWFYGHYHFSSVDRIDGTEFRCLNVNEFYEFQPN